MLLCVYGSHKSAGAGPCQLYVTCNLSDRLFIPIANLASKCDKNQSENLLVSALGVA